MDRIAELTITVRKMEVLEVERSDSVITRPKLLLTGRSEDVVTDRIAVGDRSLRVLRFGK